MTGPHSAIVAGVELIAQGQWSHPLERQSTQEVKSTPFHYHDY